MYGSGYSTIIFYICLVQAFVSKIKDFISSLHGKPDLYGPFWVAVTLCFSTAICGNLSNFIQNHGNPEFQYTPEFERVTSAASAIFGYAFVFPFLLSGIGILTCF